MQSQLSTMLLQGAKTWAGMIAVGMIVAVMAAAPAAAPLAAQDASSLAGQKHSSAAGHLDVAVTYNATLSNITSDSSVWMQGGSVEVEGFFYRGLGAVADIAGMHAANINSTGVALDLITATFGPRYTWSRHRYDFYGQGLVGQAWGTNSIFPNPAGANNVVDMEVLLDNDPDPGKTPAG
ncbi:MAG: hypothetical protein WA419_18540 [Silvibacterium sp.]